MAVGRKRKPSALHLVDGTYRNDRANAHEPQANGDIGSAPADLPASHRLLWDALLRDAPQFTLKAADRETFRAMVAHVATMREAERQMATASALIIKTKSGNYIQNPLLGVFNAATRNFLRFAAELGYTPSARARIIAGNGNADDQDEATRYLR